MDLFCPSRIVIWGFEDIASILGSTTDSLLTVESNIIIHKPTLAFMGMIKDEDTHSKVELLRNAIDQIRLLEELSDE